jgi:hypothetical protein
VYHELRDMALADLRGIVAQTRAVAAEAKRTLLT